MPSAEVARLQELLEIWRHPDGHLSVDQMQDLAAWDQTSEDDREELMKAIEERHQSAPPIHTIPLTPAEEEYVREHGLLDDPSDDKRPDA